MPLDMSVMADKPKPPANPAALRARVELGIRRAEIRRRITAADQDHFERTRLDDKRPTAETERKLRRDVVDEMHRAGKLTLEQRRAAEEIEWVRTVESSPLRAKASNFDGAGGGQSIAPPSQGFIDAKGRYRRWEVYLVGRSAMPEIPIFQRGIQIGTRPAVPFIKPHFAEGVEFANDVIVGHANATDAEGVLSVTTLSLTEAEQKFGWRNGTGSVRLRYVLAVYCALADWDAEANWKIVAAIEAEWRDARLKRSSYPKSLKRRGM